MYACVTFEIECVVETFSTERTKVPFDVAVAFHVAIQEALKLKLFAAFFTWQSTGSTRFMTFA